MGNPLCHFELQVSDPERAMKFYGSVFDWTFDSASMPGYTLVKPGTEPEGGLMRKPDHAPSFSLTNYFAVESIEETLGKVQAAGGKVACPKMEIPKVGWFAIFTDPDGISVGIFKPLPGK